MKKVYLGLSIKNVLIGLLSGLVFLLFPVSSFAQEVSKKAETGFLDRLIEMAWQTDYRTRSGSSGTLILETEKGDIDIEYRLNMNGNDFKKNLFEGRSSSQLSLSLMMEGDGTDISPFDQMTLQANISLVSDDEHTYVKVDDLKLSGEGYSSETQRFVDDLLSHFQANKGSWLLMTPDSFRNAQIEEMMEDEDATGEMDESEEEALEEQPLDVQAFLEMIFMEDDQTTQAKILNAVELLLEDVNEPSYYASQKEILVEALALLLDGDLFTSKELALGIRGGFTSLRLNTIGLSDVLSEISELLAHPLDEAQDDALNAWANNVFLNVSYDVDENVDLLNALVVELKLEDLGKIKNMSASYYFQLHSLGNALPFSVPRNAPSIDPILNDMLNR